MAKRGVGVKPGSYGKAKRGIGSKSNMSSVNYGIYLSVNYGIYLSFSMCSVCMF